MWNQIFILIFWVCLVRGGPLATDVQTTPIPPTDYILPKGIKPTNYDIIIIPLMPTNEKEPVLESTFTGTVKITATAVAEVTKIVLHAKDMEITNVKVEVDKNVIKVEYDKLDPITDFLTITPTQVIQKNNPIIITIDYKGNMRSDMYGFYLSSYDTLDNGKKITEYIGSTQMEPTHARRAFPCFDEPNFKAKFNIQIQKLPSAYTALSNMDGTRTENLDKTVTYKFEETPMMSTYLVAFVVSKFVSASNKILDKPLTVWSRTSAKAQAEYAQNIGPPVLKTIGEFTNIDYYFDGKNPDKTGVMKKMDMIAIPDFAAGAMENFGLLTYRETALLYDKALSSRQNRQRVASAVAHEQAHQWFGDLVTLDWWDNAWLNEGFATYFEYHALAQMKEGLDENCKVQDCWQMKNQFVLEEHQTALIADSILSVAPLQNPETHTPIEIKSHFDAVSYNKGGSVIRMMENFLTTNLFKESLTSYLKAYRGKNTVPKDLFDEMQKAIKNEKLLPDGKHMNDVMKNWIEKPGYPVISISLEDDKYAIEQSRFLLDGKDENVDDWTVPIFYTENPKDKNKKQLWLDGKRATIPKNADSDIIILNVESLGYFRVKYSDDLLDKIKNTLDKDSKTISDITKAALVDDILNLARANLVSYNTAFKFLEYLKKEDNYYPWSSAFAGFRFLMQRFAEDDNIGKNLRAELLKIMGEKLYKYTEDLFSETKPDKENLIATYNRVQALNWACNLGEEQCVQNSIKLFDDWMKTTKNVIPVDIKSTVFCTALRHEKVDAKDEDAKTSKYFDFLWDKYSESDVAADKITIINSLGCTKNEHNLDVFLKNSLIESEVRKQDANYVFTSVYMGNDANIKIALKFLKDNWKEIEKHYGGFNALSKVVAGLGDRVSTETDIKALQEFVSSDPVAEKIKDVKKQVLLTTDANLKWSKTRNTEIQDYLCDINKSYAGCSEKDAANSISSSILVVFLALIAHIYRNN